MGVLEFSEEELAERQYRLQFDINDREELTRALAQQYGYSLDVLRSDGRAPHLVEVRRRIARALKDRGASYPEIGRLLNRDHTSVMYLVKGRGEKKR